MPAYGPNKISDRDLELLVRWMTKDYPESHVPDYPSRLDELAAVKPAAGASEDEQGLAEVD